MEQLQAIGYNGVAYGLFADDILTAYTTDCECCIEHPVADFIRSVMVVGRCMMFQCHHLVMYHTISDKVPSEKMTIEITSQQ